MRTAEAALNEAEAANRAKTEFLSKMSHDIWTPLNGIMGLLEMDERHPDDKKLIEENREKIKVAANHLNSLLNDILQLSKLESGNVELPHEVFDLNALAADILTMAGIEANEKGIAFCHGDCSGNLIAPFVYGSPLHLRQIFLNIFSNAIKYNKPGGTIQIESTQGEGSTFVVTIPFEIAEAPETKNAETQENEVSIENLHVLVVEDNELNMEIAQLLLEDAGAVVTKAFDGKQAVDIFAGNPAGTFDAILMDVMMPNMDGYKATQTIRKLSDPQKAGITIVAMTANVFDEDKKNAYRAGMNWHIAKPIKINELMSALTEILK